MSIPNIFNSIIINEEGATFNYVINQCLKVGSKLPITNRKVGEATVHHVVYSCTFAVLFQLKHTIKDMDKATEQLPIFLDVLQELFEDGCTGYSAYWNEEWEFALEDAFETFCELHVRIKGGQFKRVRFNDSHRSENA